MQTRPHSVAVVFAAATSALLALLALVASSHGVNADEGFYVLAGIRVLEGERLYADFFYPQMPYLPLVVAGVFAAFGPALETGRLLSVVPGAIVGGMLAAAAYARSGRLAVALLVAGLYATHGLNVHYLTVTKTYGMANLALVAAILAVAVTPPAGWGRFAAGLLCALAVGTRLPAAPVAAVLGLWVAREGTGSLLRFAAGAALGALPCLWIFAADPEAFWFNNVGFHDLRREISGWGPILEQKFGVLAKWLLSPQNAMLWLLAAGGLWRAPRESALPLACAAGLAALYLYATPTYLEYMVQILPFLLLAAVPALAELCDRRALVALVVLIQFGALGYSLRPTAEDSPRGEKLSLWNLERVRAVAAHLQDQSTAGERILSWWEGYPWLAQRDGYKGVGFWESNVAKKMTAAERRRYHLFGHEEREALLRAGDPRLVVFPAGTWPELRDALAGRYELQAQIGAIQIFVRTPGGPAEGA